MQHEVKLSLNFSIAPMELSLQISVEIGKTDPFPPTVKCLGDWTNIRETGNKQV